MFNLGGLATLLHALAIAHILITPATANPADSTPQIITARAAALFQRSIAARDNATLAARADCSHPPTYNAPAITDQDFPPYNEDEANFYRYRQQQSVNLGSWFIHEKWMTRSLYDCASGSKGAEIDIAHGWGGVAGARAVLEKHWDTFIKEDDLKYLASIGINTVRLPIGYFNLGPDFTKGTPFEKAGDVYKNSWPRIVRTINQANKYGIGVLVDLHGAVGSQNGADHSGVSDHKTQLFSNKSYQDKTVDVLVYLAKQLVKVNNVVGIQILNEPHNDNALVPFYDRAITAMRDTSAEAKGFPLYIHDAFNLEKFSAYVAARKDFVVQDYHSYFVFTDDQKSKTAAQNTAVIKGGLKGRLQSSSDKQRRNIVVDEWSCAVSNAGSADASRDFCTSQLNTYSQTTAGWSFWAYNKDGCENDAGWCFKAAVGKNLPKTFFSYSSSNGKVPASIASSSSVDLNSSPSNGTASSNTNNNDHNETPSSASPSSPSPSSTPSSSSTCSSHKARSLHKLQKRSVHARVAHEKRDAAQEANERGYKDGMQTAKNFAAFNLSKLGFRQQFINDNVAKLGSGVIKPSNANDYATGFSKGLKDGEAEVQKAL